MNPVSFHNKEVAYTSSDPSISPLPVLRITYGDNSKGLISCWKPGLRDILRIVFGKPIFLIVLGAQQPPVSVLTGRNEVIGKNN